MPAVSEPVEQAELPAVRRVLRLLPVAQPVDRAQERVIRKTGTRKMADSPSTRARKSPAGTDDGSVDRPARRPWPRRRRPRRGRRGSRRRPVRCSPTDRSRPVRERNRPGTPLDSERPRPQRGASHSLMTHRHQSADGHPGQGQDDREQDVDQVHVDLPLLQNAEPGEPLAPSARRTARRARRLTGSGQSEANSPLDGNSPVGACALRPRSEEARQQIARRSSPRTTARCTACAPSARHTRSPRSVLEVARPPDKDQEHGGQHPRSPPRSRR